MSQHQFQLQPFVPIDDCNPSQSVQTSSPLFTGLVSRQASVLHLQYKLEGDLAALVIPAPAQPIQRLDGLWETTCFECFLGVPGDRRYWEFNFSPSGHWNCYAFSDYRQRASGEAGMTQDCSQGHEPLPMHWLRSGDCLGLLITLDLTDLGLALSPLELSVSAVLEWQQEQMDYWAIQHCSQQADFHLRESFRLQLPVSEFLDAI